MLWLATLVGHDGCMNLLKHVWSPFSYTAGVLYYYLGWVGTSQWDMPMGHPHGLSKTTHITHYGPLPAHSQLTIHTIRLFVFAALAHCNLLLTHNNVRSRAFVKH